jgi:hypothetical protein
MRAERIRNGMPAADLGPDSWRKPWSDNGGSCLEAKQIAGLFAGSGGAPVPTAPVTAERSHAAAAAVPAGAVAAGLEGAERGAEGLQRVTQPGGRPGPWPAAAR